MAFAISNDFCGKHSLVYIVCSSMAQDKRVNGQVVITLSHWVSQSGPELTRQQY